MCCFSVGSVVVFDGCSYLDVDSAEGIQVIIKSNYGFFMIPIVLVSIQSAATLKLLIAIFKVKY